MPGGAGADASAKDRRRHGVERVRALQRATRSATSRCSRCRETSPPS